MLPGLNPMFMLEFRGTDTQVARFVTPDRDVTLEFHCHVETHEKMGMHGLLIVGRGSRTGGSERHPTEGEKQRRLYRGVGLYSQWICAQAELSSIMRRSRALWRPW